MSIGDHTDAMTYECGGLMDGAEQLVAVATLGQITAAADHLGVPQPTLSRSIARLSDALGVPLVRPDGRGIALTRHGELLAAHARRALAEMASGVRAVRAEVDPDSGTVVLAFLHSLGPSVIPALLKGFRRSHPRVSVQLTQDSAAAILSRVVQGSADLALAAPVPDDPALESTALAQQPLILLVPRQHRLAGRGTVALPELAGLELITLASGYGVRTITDGLLRSSGVPLKYAFESQEMTTAAGLVAADLGVAILPPGNRVPGTAEVVIDHPDATRTISLAWPRHRTLSPPAVALRDHLLVSAPPLLAP